MRMGFIFTIDGCFPVSCSCQSAGIVVHIVYLNKLNRPAHVTLITVAWQPHSIKSGRVVHTLHVSLHTILMKYQFFGGERSFNLLGKYYWAQWSRTIGNYLCVFLHMWEQIQLMMRATDHPQQNIDICIHTGSSWRKKVNVDKLHNDDFSIKRLMPCSCVTFCLLNIHRPGFGELNLPYEYEVIEKYISSIQSWVISQRIQILAHKKGTQNRNFGLNQKSLLTYSAPWLIVTYPSM